jgi:hypothetical protein
MEAGSIPSKGSHQGEHALCLLVPVKKGPKDLLQVVNWSELFLSPLLLLNITTGATGGNWRFGKDTG